MVVESKQCVVFGLWRADRSGYDWYGFDSSFSPVESLKGSYDSEDDCGYDSDDVGHTFFEFDIFNHLKLEDDSPVAKPLVTLDGFRLNASIGSWNGCVFRVGGCYYTEQEMLEIHKSPDDPRRNRLNRYTNRVDYWNPAEQGSQWERHSRMNQARSCCMVLALGQRMYVAGGAFVYSDNNNNNKGIIFMEEFESEKRGWVGVENPPEDSYLMEAREMVCAAWEGEGKLLFGSEACTHFYAYKPASSSWERCDHLRFDKSALDSSTSYPGVVVGDHCLWLDWSCKGNFLIGLNLVKGRYFIIHLRSERLLPIPSFAIYTPLLLHLGDGKLCLVWRDNTLYRVQGEHEEESSSSSDSSSDDSSEEEEEEEEEVDEEQEEQEEEDETDSISEEEKVESQMKKNENNAMDNLFGGYRCNEFVIDFRRAFKKGSVLKARARDRARLKKGKSCKQPRATGCLRVISRRKLIAPSLHPSLLHAFALNVAVPKDTGGGHSMPDSAVEVAASDNKHQAEANAVLRPSKRRMLNKGKSV